MAVANVVVQVSAMVIPVVAWVTVPKNQTKTVSKTSQKLINTSEMCGKKNSKQTSPTYLVFKGPVRSGFLAKNGLTVNCNQSIKFPGPQKPDWTA